MFKSIKSYRKDIDFQRELIEEDYFENYIDTEEYNNLIEQLNSYEEKLDQLEKNKKEIKVLKALKRKAILKNIIK